jgi:hypothetical protein
MLKWQWIIIAAGVIMEAGIWIIMSKRLPPQIPLYYSRPWGEEQLTGTIYIWLPLFIAIITAGIITLVVKKIKPDKVLAVILTGAGIISELILILAVLRTVILII